MFRPTDPQASLLESRFLVPPEKRARLEKSWAQAFRDHILPAIDEEVFRDCFHDDNGRPNKSIRLLTGLHLLKEWDDLTDEQVIDQLEFNLQWHHALAVDPGEAHVCQKTLHNYRVKLMGDDRAQDMFDRVTRRLIDADGLGVGRQRLDSTHVMSNIAVLTRLGLFVETVTHFLKELRRGVPERLDALEGGYAKRYLDREGYFADAKREQARRRLPVVASDLLALVRAFEADEEIRAWESYLLLVRLLEEQCEVVDSDDAGGSTEEPPVEVGQLSEARRKPVVEVSEGDAEDSEVEPGGEGTEAIEPGDVKKVEAEGEGRGEKDDDDDDQTLEDAVPQEPQVRLKEGKDISGTSLQSPHDPDATYGHKGKGYEVQLVETCEDTNPYQVVTGIEVNGANESDQHATVPMVEQLLGNGLAPYVLLADTAYGSGENMVQCAEYGVDLQAPVQDPGAPPAVDHWADPVDPTKNTVNPQVGGHGEPVTGPPGSDPPADDAATGMLDLGSFRFNETYWEVVSCPQGHAPKEQEVRDAPVPYRAVFDGSQCAECPLAEHCPTRKLASGDRVLRWRDAKAATATRQREQQEKAFKEAYKLRSGVESTAGEYKGRHGAKKMRVRGGAHVRMMAFLKGAALNTKRAVQYHTRQLTQPADPGLAHAGAPT